MANRKLVKWWCSEPESERVIEQSEAELLIADGMLCPLGKEYRSCQGCEVKMQIIELSEAPTCASPASSEIGRLKDGFDQAKKSMGKFGKSLNGLSKSLQKLK